MSDSLRTIYRSLRRKAPRYRPSDRHRTQRGQFPHWRPGAAVRTGRLRVPRRAHSPLVWTSWCMVTVMATDYLSAWASTRSSSEPHCTRRSTASSARARAAPAQHLVGALRFVSPRLGWLPRFARPIYTASERLVKSSTSAYSSSTGRDRSSNPAGPLSGPNIHIFRLASTTPRLIDEHPRRSASAPKRICVRQQTTPSHHLRHDCFRVARPRQRSELIAFESRPFPYGTAIFG